MDTAREDGDGLGFASAVSVSLWVTRGVAVGNGPPSLPTRRWVEAEIDGETGCPGEVTSDVVVVVVVVSVAAGLSI